MVANVCQRWDPCLPQAYQLQCLLGIVWNGRQHTGGVTHWLPWGACPLGQPLKGTVGSNNLPFVELEQLGCILTKEGMKE